VGDDWSRDRSVDSFFEVALSHVPHEFDAPGLIEVANVVGDVIRLPANYLCDVRSAEIPLVESRHDPKPDVVVDGESGRVLWQSGPLSNRPSPRFQRCAFQCQSLRSISSGFFEISEHKG